MERLEVKQYDKKWGAYKQYTDWVTEYNYYSEKSLTIEEFDAVIENEGHHIAGELTYKKYKQTYAGGKIIYKHVLLEVMY